MAALDPMGLTGEGGVVSETTPGVFIQVKLMIFAKNLIDDIHCVPKTIKNQFKTYTSKKT